jgi:2-(1,2-epoxy-1,2-dihydrophenyl)acetyl-CoA isomerase
MKPRYSALTCETDYFSARQEGTIVIFRPKGNQLLTSTLIRAKEAVLDYFTFAADHPDARIVVLMPQKRKIQREEYLSFFDMVRSSRISESSVMRLYRAIDQIILHILTSDLFFISADHGQILPMFASIYMACDYRIVSDDAIFQNPAIELGLVPKGGFAWFLNQMLGRVKALELMLTNERIIAEEAMALGLVNRCVPVGNLEVKVLSAAKQFEALPGTSLGMAKRLVNRASKGLKEYLEYENHELIRALVPKSIGILKFKK